MRESLSQDEAAKSVGVHANTWSDWENGRKTPRTETALEIDVLTKGACPIESWADEETASKWRERHQQGVESGESAALAP